MRVRVPVTIKQKFDINAQAAYRKSLEPNCEELTVRGLAMVSGALEADWLKLSWLTNGYVSLEVPLSKLEELSRFSNLTYFELSSPMS